MRMLRDIESTAALRLSVTSRTARALRAALSRLMSEPTIMSMITVKMLIETIISMSVKPRTGFFFVAKLLSKVNFIKLFDRDLASSPHFYSSTVASNGLDGNLVTRIVISITETIFAVDKRIGIWAGKDDIGIH